MYTTGYVLKKKINIFLILAIKKLTVLWVLCQMPNYEPKIKHTKIILFLKLIF